jgi:hypothetical protein
MAHLERMYDKAAHEPDARHDIVWSATFKGLPVCQAFLQRVMQETSSSDAQRLKAALGYLAAELEPQKGS